MTTVSQPKKGEKTVGAVRGAARMVVGFPGWFAARVRNIVGRAARNDITAVGSQFAYNAFLGTVPFLLVLVTLVSLVPGPFGYNELLDEYGTGFPPELREVIDDAVTQANLNSRGTGALVLALSLLGALYVASNVMGTLIGGIDHARGVRHRSWLRGKVVGALFALASGLLITLTTVALVGGPGLIDEVSRRLTDSTAPGLVQSLITLLGLVAFFVVVLGLYTLGTAAGRRALMVEVPGALIATCGWLIVTQLFAFYVGNVRSFEPIYGTFAGVVVYLLFLFFTGTLIVLGAEINQELVDDRERRRPRSVTPTTPIPVTDVTAPLDRDS